jgi:hypothetical protein
MASPVTCTPPTRVVYPDGIRFPLRASPALLTNGPEKESPWVRIKRRPDRPQAHDQ